MSSFQDLAAQAELEGGDEYIEVKVTEPHKVNSAHESQVYGLIRKIVYMEVKVAEPREANIYRAWHKVSYVHRGQV